MKDARAAWAARQQARAQAEHDALAQQLAEAHAQIEANEARIADLHYQQYARAGAVNARDGTLLPTGVQLGLGVRPSAVSVILSQGSLSQTDGDLDIAIDGPAPGGGRS